MPKLKRNSISLPVLSHIPQQKAAKTAQKSASVRRRRRLYTLMASVTTKKIMKCKALETAIPRTFDSMIRGWEGG